MALAAIVVLQIYLCLKHYGKSMFRMLEVTIRLKAKGKNIFEVLRPSRFRPLKVKISKKKIGIQQVLLQVKSMRKTVSGRKSDTR